MNEELVGRLKEIERKLNNCDDESAWEDARSISDAITALSPPAGEATGWQSDDPNNWYFTGGHPLMIDSGTFWRCPHGITMLHSAGRCDDCKQSATPVFTHPGPQSSPTPTREEIARALYVAFEPNGYFHEARGIHWDEDRNTTPTDARTKAYRLADAVAKLFQSPESDDATAKGPDDDAAATYEKGWKAGHAAAISDADIQVGGGYWNCDKCGETSHASEIHDCPKDDATAPQERT